MSHPRAAVAPTVADVLTVVDVHGVLLVSVSAVAGAPYAVNVHSAIGISNLFGFPAVAVVHAVVGVPAIKRDKQFFLP